MNKLAELNERLTRNNMDPVYEMNSFDEILQELSPSELLYRTQGGNFNINDEYFEFDGYANLVSYEELDEVLELYDDIV